ncbi:THAP domain-containing protein 1-like [Ixodes scapularis]
MPACSAVNCTSRPEKTSGKTFHLFPRCQPKLYQQWVVNLKRDKWKPSPGSRLCSDHFDDSCFDRTGARTRLRSGAVPTLFNFPEHLQKVAEHNYAVKDTPKTLKRKLDTCATAATNAKKKLKLSQQ